MKLEVKIIKTKKYGGWTSLASFLQIGNKIEKKIGENESDQLIEALGLSVQKSTKSLRVGRKKGFVDVYYS